MGSIGNITLSYTSPDFKYQQLILVPDTEICDISQSTLKALFEEKIKAGMPHFLALVHSAERGQNIYDGAALCESLVNHRNWEWKNPASNALIKKIDFFVLSSMKGDYMLLKEIKMKSHSGQIYEDLWFCSNLSFATETDNPFAFHPIIAVIRHFVKKAETEQVKKWKFILFKDIENRWGRGVALLFLPLISQETFKLDPISYIENFLFQNLDYSCLNDLVKGSELEAFTSNLTKDFFSVKDQEERTNRVKALWEQILQGKSEDPVAQFVRFLSLSVAKRSIQSATLEILAKSSHKGVSHLAQAVLCSIPNFPRENYLDRLIESQPNWTLGKFLKLYYSMDGLRGNDLNEQFNKMLQLSRGSTDLILLKLLMKTFIEYEGTSVTWRSAEHLGMRILSLSRFEEATVEAVVDAMKANDELENALFVQTNTYESSNSYGSLAVLSDLQRESGIKKRDKQLYLTGVQNGLNIFANRSRHQRLMYDLGRDLIAEITPFKATKQQEDKGKEILIDEFNSNPKHLLVETILREYLIRKGTEREAKESLARVDTMKVTYANLTSVNPTLQASSIRGRLRFAEKREDLQIVEEQIKEFEKLGKTPIFYLLKALLQSHPLKRQATPEWFILAFDNFKKAYENADTQDVQFLLDHLSRFDKLKEEEQTQCRAIILEILGLS